MTTEESTLVNDEHRAWLKGLDFYRENLRIQERRLLELAARPPDEELSKGIEHFQNQFLVQHNTIDELRHAIREHVSVSGRNIAAGDEHTEGDLSINHQELKDGYQSFEKVMNELRHEFGNFLSHWHP